MQTTLLLSQSTFFTNSQLQIAQTLKMAANTRELARKLHTAVLMNNLDEAIKLLDSGLVDVNVEYAFYNRTQKQTPLHVAAYGGWSLMAKFLIESGADLKAADNQGRTPLHRAAVAGSKEVVQLLIDNGAVLDAIDTRGQTPLYLAASSRKIEVSKVLIECGADINKADQHGMTPARWLQGVLKLMK